jgi:hypothetical protein
MLALGGIGIAAASLVGLVVSENASLFGFMDHGYRPAVIAAIAAEAATILALSAYLVLAGVRRPRVGSAPAH